MAKEAVDKILAAEMSAEKIENDARARASVIVSATKEEAAEIIENSRAFASKASDEKIAEAKGEAEKILAEAGLFDDTEIFKDLKNKRSDAIDAVINALI